MTVWAKVTTRFEGIHNYPAAPKQVEFLKHPHRHEFHVTLYVEQFHNDRDVEYILCKRWLNTFLKAYTAEGELQARSCEMMALDIGKAAQTAWLAHEGTHRKLMVEVTEDGENGALVEL